MENNLKETIVFDKCTIKNFFKEYIEESRNSIEKKTQEMLSLASSIKEENEQFISKSK